jgi:succinate dehydrogenase / fumarate reductase membrane anchor subunit
MSNGTIQWLWQRFSALVLLAYTVYLACFIISTPEISYSVLLDFFSSLVARLMTTLALIALAMHAWVGMWSVTTDYLTERAMGRFANPLRLFIQMIILITLFIYLGVGFSVVWLGSN